MTFKVEKNSKGYTADDVAQRIGKIPYYPWLYSYISIYRCFNQLVVIFSESIKDELRRQTGAKVLATGVGDRVSIKTLRILFILLSYSLFFFHYIIFETSFLIIYLYCNITMLVTI